MHNVQMKPEISDGKKFQAIKLSIETIPELFNITRLFSVKIHNRISINSGFFITLEFINHELLTEGDMVNEALFSNIIIFSKVPLGHWLVFADNCNVQLYTEDNFNSLFNFI